MSTHSIGKTFVAMLALGAVAGGVVNAGAATTITGTTVTGAPVSTVGQTPILQLLPPYVRRIPASACQNYELVSGAFTDMQIASNSAHDVAPQGLHEEDLICPIPSDSTLSHAQLGSLKVYGRDNTTTSHDSAQLCVTYTTTEGGACGWASIYSGWPYTGAPNTGSPFVGDYAITFVAGGIPGYNVYGGDSSLDPFSEHPNDLPYVWVEVAPGDTFRGIVVSQ